MATTPMFSTDNALARLRQSVHAKAGNFYAMYSSILGGIVTDQALMVLPLDDHMVHRGHAVFDTATLTHGMLYQLDPHLDRFLRSAELARIPLPFPRERLRQIILDTAAASGHLDGSVRYWLSAGPGGYALGPAECVGSSFYVIVFKQEAYPESYYTEGIKVTPVERAEDAVRSCDIVATCTDSIQVVVSDPALIEPGMHLTSVKSNEWHPEIVRKADLVFKMGQATMNLDVGQIRIGGEAAVVAGNAEEIKRIANPKVDIFSADFPLLTDVMSGKLKGRTSRNQVTFFANSGTQGLQFASTAGYVVREAKRRGLGQEIPTGWFLQDIRD